MARQRGALDRRLLDLRSVTAEVLATVLKEHDCSRPECPACGYVPTRRQRVCRSVAVAQGLVRGRAPRWAGDEPAEVPGLGAAEGGGDQRELFNADQVMGTGDGSRRGAAGRGGG